MWHEEACELGKAKTQRVGCHQAARSALPAKWHHSCMHPAHLSVTSGNFLLQVTTYLMSLQSQRQQAQQQCKGETQLWAAAARPAGATGKALTKRCFSCLLLACKDAQMMAKPGRMQIATSMRHHYHVGFIRKQAWTQLKLL